MRLHHLMASCALVAFAAENDQGARPISAPSDGQIALTAHNDGDGTWSVIRGPGGPVLRSGLAREQAFAIVGGATGPYDPENEQEAQAAEQRAQIEAEEAEREATEVFQSDEEAGSPDKVANSEAAKLSAENSDLRRDIASKDETIRQLQEQVAKFDGDGDGKPGGSLPTPGQDGAGDQSETGNASETGGGGNETSAAGEPGADVTNAPPVEIPADWADLHWTQRVKLAKAISGDEDAEVTADQANDQITAEVARRSSTAGVDGVEGAGNNGGE